MPQCMETHRHSRFCSKVVVRSVRNQEPSTMPLKNVLQSLKFTKFRQKRRKMLQTALHVSLLLHVIAEKINSGK